MQNLNLKKKYMEANTIRMRLKKVLNKTNLTQKQFSEKMGVTS